MKMFKVALHKIHHVIDTVFSFISVNIMTISLAWILLAFSICIVFRYFMSYSLAKLEESYTIALVFLALFGSSYSFKMRSNTTFDLLYDVLPAKAKIALDIISKVIVIVVFGIMLKPVWQDILFYNMRKTALLKISYMLLYFPFIMILLSGIYYNIYYLITEDIKKILNLRGD